MLTIDVLISTINRRILNIKPLPILKGVHYVLCHQITEPMEVQIPQSLNRHDIDIISCKEHGLSLSRNTCIKHSTADICLISDDDIEYTKNFDKKIRDAFSLFCNADIITFMTLNKNTGNPIKKYPLQSFQITTKKGMRLCSPISIGIAFRRKSIQENHLFFNELFGLGALFPAGEEQVFINEALEKKMGVFFFPEFIASHPEETTGTRRYESKDIIKAIGAFYCNVYSRPLSWLLCLRNATTYHENYKQNFSFFEYLMTMLNGEYLYHKIVKSRT